MSTRLSRKRSATFVLVLPVAVAALVAFLASCGSSAPSENGSQSSPSNEGGSITLTGENRINVLGLHNDDLTPCSATAFTGNPLLALTYTDNNKHLSLTVKVDSNAGASPFNVVGSKTATGAHATLSVSGFSEDATSGTVNQTAKTGHFELHFPAASGTTVSAPFVAGLPLNVIGDFACP